MPEDSLKDKTVKGVGWSAIDNISSFAITFIVGIILARLLSPEDYGLLGLIGIFTAICGCFINAGFGSALIRKKDATEDDYNTVFICNLLTSITAYGILFVCAPFIADFFGREELIALTRVSSLGMIIGALAFVQRTRLTKQINFKAQTKITIISAIVRSITGISTALCGWGVWALVSQELVGSIASTCLLWYHNKWIPNLRFSTASFKELFNFGSKLLLSNIINTIWNQSYQIVIGKYYSPAVLGQYTRATMFSGLLSENLTSVIQRVSYPVLSSIQEDKSRLKEGYRRLIKTTMLITFASTLMLAAVAKPLILVLIGEKWLQAVGFLQIVCFSSMLYPLHAINLNMLQVQGRSDLYLRLEIIKKIIAVGPILLGIIMGIYWMLFGSVVVGFISYYLNAYYSGPFLDYGMRAQIQDIMPGFLIGLTGAIVAFMPSLAYDILELGESWSNAAFVLLPLQIILGLSVILILCEHFKPLEYIELKGIGIEQIRRIKKKTV